jgi:hypothetical protein
MIPAPYNESPESRYKHDTAAPHTNAHETPQSGVAKPHGNANAMVRDSEPKPHARSFWTRCALEVTRQIPVGGVSLLFSAAFQLMLMNAKSAPAMSPILLATAGGLVAGAVTRATIACNNEERESVSLSRSFLKGGIVGAGMAAYGLSMARALLVG